MDTIAPEVRGRMPLAEASLLIWRHICDPDYLEQLFDEQRGRHYTRILAFPALVQLIADALLVHHGSGRRAFEDAREARTLPVSIQATYGKLRRMPIPLSAAFLAGCSDRLRELYVAPKDDSLPASMREFEVLALDGKTIKWVQKRLKAVRHAPGGVVGGKALVAMSLRSGLVIGMHAHPDGDANEVQFVHQLLPAIRSRSAGRHLWLADRAFGYPTLVTRFAQEEDAFLVRARAVVAFEADSSRPLRRGRDGEGRSYTQAWGWLGRAGGPRRCYVRRITLQLTEGKPLQLLTNMLDARRYPAVDLLALYRTRWGIERVFQQVTEVFGLRPLIGTSPEATVFQFAFCLLIYNVIQMTRAWLSAAQQREMETISNEKLFDDMKQQLIAWMVLMPASQTVTHFARWNTTEKARARLHELLDRLWRDRWIKNPPSKRRHRAPPTGRRTHSSAHRLIQAQRTENAGQNRDPRNTTRCLQR
jgi:hypothetical protein